MTRPRLAFVAPYGYPALASHTESDGFDYVGGAEMQQARLLRTLAARGHDVWMVSADFGQPQRVTVDGVTVERAYAPFAGVKGLRFFHPRWSGILRALERVRPDVVYQRTAGALTGQCALWARTRGRRFVFACAHDFDTLRDSPAMGSVRGKILYHWGLTHADCVLAQTASQAAGLLANWGIEAALVRNLIPLPAQPRAWEHADAVLWLGTIKADKRPQWILEAARALPDTRFVVAGGPPPAPTSSAYFHEFRAEAARLPNVEILGFVPPDRVPALFASAALFAHTSPAEGFPNTLLEAWSQGVPSVSAIDPDGAVRAFGTGVVVADVTAFISALGALMADAARRRALGAGARAYVEQRHAPAAVATAFESALGLEHARGAD